MDRPSTMDEAREARDIARSHGLEVTA